MDRIERCNHKGCGRERLRSVRVWERLGTTVNNGLGKALCEVGADYLNFRLPNLRWHCWRPAIQIRRVQVVGITQGEVAKADVGGIDHEEHSDAPAADDDKRAFPHRGPQLGR